MENFSISIIVLKTWKTKKPNKTQPIWIQWRPNFLNFLWLLVSPWWNFDVIILCVFFPIIIVIVLPSQSLKWLEWRKNVSTNNKHILFCFWSWKRSCFFEKESSECLSLKSNSHLNINLKHDRALSLSSTESSVKPRMFACGILFFLPFLPSFSVFPPFILLILTNVLLSFASVHPLLHSPSQRHPMCSTQHTFWNKFLNLF